jgi:hypothetical protein
MIFRTVAQVGFLGLRREKVRAVQPPSAVLRHLDQLEVMEYRVEQHAVNLGERLRALQAVGQPTSDTVSAQTDEQGRQKQELGMDLAPALTRLIRTT